MVKITFAITTYAYCVFHALALFKRVQAVATPLKTTAIAAHSANTEKR